MVLFPCVEMPLGKNALFKSLTYTEYPIPGKQYITFPDDDDFSGTEGLSVDSNLLGEKNAAQAIMSAISASPARSGYLTSNVHEKLQGASLGLACAIELCFPNKFPHIAFTGFVTSLVSGDCTFKVHDVDKIDVKIQSALRQSIPLVVPYSAYVADNWPALGILTPKLITSHPPTSPFRIGTCYSLLEASVVAEYL